METKPASRSRRAHKRITESQVSAVLGLVLLFFFIDGFVRDTTVLGAVVLLPLGCLIVIGLWRIADPSPVRRIEWHAIAMSIAGTLIVGIGVRWLGMSSVVAAAAVGITAGLLPRVVSRIAPATATPLYVGAFAGMTSPVVLLGVQWLLLAAVITGCVWSVARDTWIGIGGKMGTVAFVGVGLTTAIAAISGNSAGLGTLSNYGIVEFAVIMLASLASALLTHWLSYARGLGPVLGSALPVAVIAIAMIALRQAVDFPNDALIAAWFGASFVGMTSPSRLDGRRWMLPAMALVLGIFMTTFDSTLAGLGGDLGATAAAAVICVIGVKALLR